MYSFYWAVAVMMGNDALPDTTEQKLFTAAVILLGMLVNSALATGRHTSHGCGAAAPLSARGLT